MLWGVLPRRICVMGFAAFLIRQMRQFSWRLVAQLFRLALEPGTRPYLSPTSNGRRLRSGAFLDPLVLWSWIVSCSTRTIGVLSNMMLLMGPRVLIGKDRRECEERMARPLCLLGSWRAPPPSRKRWNWMYPTQEHLRMEGASPNSQPLSSLSLTLFFSSIYSKIFIFFRIWTQNLTCNAVSI